MCFTLQTADTSVSTPVLNNEQQKSGTTASYVQYM